MEHVARWSLHAVRVPYTRAIRWSDVDEDAATVMLLRLFTSDGREGVAEATVKPTWSGVSVRSLTSAIEDVVLPLVQGVAIAGVAQRMARIPENVTAKALVSNALHDLTQAGPDAMSVPVSWTVTRDTPDAMAHDAARMVEAHGFRVLKVKGGQGVQVDRDAVRAIRAAVGPGVRFYVDANGAYRHDEAVAYCAMLADEGVSHVEDPCPLEADASFASLQSASPVPIIVDLAAASLRDVRAFLGRGMRCFGAKPGRNGADDVLAMASAAAAFDCAWHVGLFGETDAGSYSALRLSARHAASTALPAENTLFLLMRASLLREPVEVRDGRAALPYARNLAELVDWRAVGALQH